MPTPATAPTTQIRVDAGQMRARVVGEGGNLGFTQLGRIEYALAGGRINTDAIDNSAGVDCSDHEVNIKILLGIAVERGDLDMAGRDELMASVADRVCELVLYDNYLQAQILSQEEAAATERLDAHEALMRELESAGVLDRAIEFLPSGEELATRRSAGKGLTRPELRGPARLRQAQPAYPRAGLDAARRPLARSRAARVLPGAPDGGHRRAVPRAPAAARDHRHRRHERRRQLARHHLGRAHAQPRPGRSPPMPSAHTGSRARSAAPFPAGSGSRRCSAPRWSSRRFSTS